MIQHNKLKATNDAILREDRRRKVMQYLQLSISETEIAQRLGVTKSTITRDIQHLREVAQQFITSLAKDNLALWYKDLLDDTNKARQNAWAVFYKCSELEKREKLLALKTVIASNESIFNLLQAGPTVMSVKGIQEQLNMLLQRDRALDDTAKILADAKAKVAVTGKDDTGPSEEHLTEEQSQQQQKILELG